MSRPATSSRFNVFTKSYPSNVLVKLTEEFGFFPSHATPPVPLPISVGVSPVFVTDLIPVDRNASSLNILYVSLSFPSMGI